MPKKDSLTTDPFFIAVVAAIEKIIAEGDRIARANKIQLTDAQIISDCELESPQAMKLLKFVRDRIPSLDALSS